MLCPGWAIITKKHGKYKVEITWFCIKVCCPNFSSHFLFRSVKFIYCNLHQQVHTVVQGLAEIPDDFAKQL
jgi:hypothetical protein